MSVRGRFQNSSARTKRHNPLPAFIANSNPNQHLIQNWLRFEKPPNASQSLSIRGPFQNSPDRTKLPNPQPAPPPTPTQTSSLSKIGFVLKNRLRLAIHVHPWPIPKLLRPHKTAHSPARLHRQLQPKPATYPELASFRKTAQPSKSASIRLQSKLPWHSERLRFFTQSRGFLSPRNGFVFSTPQASPPSGVKQPKPIQHYQHI